MVNQIFISAREALFPAPCTSLGSVRGRLAREVQAHVLRCTCNGFAIATVHENGGRRERRLINQRKKERKKGRRLLLIADEDKKKKK